MELPDIIRDIYNTFIDYYDENRVDIQYNQIDKYTIIVYWPEVTVTNEYGNSVVIWELYARVSISREGRLLDRPKFIRSEYNNEQWNSNYLHSHVSTIPKRDPSEWQYSCLGNGPINITIAKLKGCKWTGDITGGHHSTEYNYMTQKLYNDVLVWNLFCWELDKYVHIESLAGVPYKKISEIGTNNSGKNTIYSIPVVRNYRSVNPIVKSFIPYLLTNNVCKFNFYDGSYHIGVSHKDLVLSISNAFIHWYNLPSNSNIRENFPKDTIKNEYMQQVLVGHSFFVPLQESNSSPLQDSLGAYVLTFKEQRIVLTRNGSNTTPEVILILNPSIIGYILYKILRFINIYYGKIQIQEKADDNQISCTTTNTSTIVSTSKNSCRVSEKARAL